MLSHTIFRRKGVDGSGIIMRDLNVKFMFSNLFRLAEFSFDKFCKLKF